MLQQVPSWYSDWKPDLAKLSINIPYHGLDLHLLKSTGKRTHIFSSETDSL